MNKIVALHAIIKLLRPHQWSKNMLCVVPLLAAHRWKDYSSWLATIEVTLMISVSASALYIVNDIVDVENDKVHPVKKSRPIASGQVGLFGALLLSWGLLGAAVLTSSFLSSAMLGVVVTYCVLSASYTFLLKKVPVIDIVSLSLLYGFRLVAGAAAAAISLSDWLLSFSFFLMLSLAAAKRHAELLEFVEGARVRGYDTLDISFVRSLGLSSAISSAVVLCFYIQSSHVMALYAYPRRLWVILPAFVCWVAMFWRKAVRGEVHSDPVWEVIKNPVSYVFAAIAAFAVIIARPLPS